MPFDAGLACRLQAMFGHLPELVETRMFGGFGYLHQGNMCVGIYYDSLILRVGVAAAESLGREEHVGPMDITGKPMKGWVKVAAEGTTEDDALARYCRYALNFVATLPAKKPAR
ncbi:TfoX/Sxy family protein [bacterium]|nr:TfoX/Sxy family protein [bacterium]